MMFTKNDQYFEPMRIPAIHYKYGQKDCFSFMVEPYYLLRIAYVHRRGSGLRDIKDVILTYQRMLIESKLKKIHDYLKNKDALPFPNNIIINFDSMPTFELSELDQKSERRHCYITLPRKFGSAWVIDGQHRLFGYAQSDQKTKDQLPVFAYVKLSNKEQARLFIDINQNQKSISPNLLWDLKEELYKGSDDPDQIKEWVISCAGKRLATDIKSPLYNCISIPSLPEIGQNPTITLNTICYSLLNSGILSDRYIKIDYSNPDTSTDLLLSVLFEHFSVFKENLEEDWNQGKQGFSKSSNGIASLIWLLKSSLHFLLIENKQKLFENINKSKELNIEFQKIYSPIIKLLKGQKGLSKKLRQMRGVGGQKESANIMCRVIGIEFPNFPLVMKEEKDTNIDFEELIKSTENTNLEYKGSLSLDLNRLFKGDRLKSFNTNIAIEGVLRSICGFLNTAGGNLVIGILENDKFTEEEIKAHNCGVENLEGRLLIGINNEYKSNGWDGFLLKITELISSHINPEVIDLGLVKIECESINSLDFCRIQVKKSENKQYLDKEHFFVRRENKTDELKGPEIDSFWENRKTLFLVD